MAEHEIECIDWQSVWVSSENPSKAQLPRVCLPSDSQQSGVARQSGHLLIGNGPPTSRPPHPSPYTLTRYHLSLSQQTFPVSTHLSLTYWKLLEIFLPCLVSPHPPPTPAPLKSPLNSVVMQTVNLRRVRARCWLRRGWVSNAAITSGGDSGWIIIKASPLPLMWTCLINTRLLGGTRQMNRRRMIGKGVALLIHPPAECFVTMPQDRERHGAGQECTQFRKKEEFFFCWPSFIQCRTVNGGWCAVFDYSRKQKLFRQ